MLCEKPLVLDVEEATELRDYAAELERTLVVGFQRHQDLSVRKARGRRIVRRDRGNSSGIFAVAYFAFAVNVIGYVIFFTLLRRGGAFEVSLINYLQPIAAAIIGWVVLSVHLEPLTVAGFGVIIAGFVPVKREQSREYARRQRAFDRW